MVPLLSFGMQISMYCCLIYVVLKCIGCAWWLTVGIYLLNRFRLVKSYDMPCNVESASLEPRLGNKFIAGGEDMWVRLFDFHTGEQIGTIRGLACNELEAGRQAELLMSCFLL